MEIERTCRRDVELSEFCSRRPADPEVSELLAEACAKVSNAILDSGLRREHARDRRALAWARQASRLCGEDSQNTSLALMCEGNALHRLGSWKCAADVFERLRDDKTYGKEAQEEAKGLREKLQKLEKGEGLAEDNGQKLLTKKVVEKERPLDGTSPCKILDGVGKNHPQKDTPIRDAYFKDSSAMKTKRQLFLRRYDQPEESAMGRDVLLRFLRARQGRELVFISWNAQLMNKLDGPNDSEICDAIPKCCSAAKQLQLGNAGDDPRNSWLPGAAHRDGEVAGGSAQSSRAARSRGRSPPARSSGPASYAGALRDQLIARRGGEGGWCM